MKGLATYNFKISQLWQDGGEHGLNTCGNPDCSNFGHSLTTAVGRRRTWSKARPDLTDAQLDEIERNGPGAYKISGADKDFRRVSRTFEYEQVPLEWTDQRTIRCRGITRNGSLCNSGFSILSGDHLEEETDRLRNHNGVLDGPACGCCGTRFLAKPEEFTLKGAHQRTKDRAGRTIENRGTPKAVRVLHKPCKGRKGARITIALPHERQKTTKDNVRILHALLNSAGILDIQRMLGAAATGQKIGIARIYDRIAWFEQVFLAYEREMLRRWKEKVEREGRPVEHRLSHDDLALSVNWETATDQRITQLNCAITADAVSGYVYRIDVDFDPRITPLELFRQTYLDDNGAPTNLRRNYPNTKIGSAPLFSWQRPTGRLHESQFFAACINELRAFRAKARRRMPQNSQIASDARAGVLAEVDLRMEEIRTIGEKWFGFPADTTDTRGSFRGMTTRDIYTKAAHFVLLREMLPSGRIVLTTEQEATLPAILPHVFSREIRENRFTWLAMTFAKAAKKPEILGKVKRYRTDWRRFRDDGMSCCRFPVDADAETITRAFIAERMTVATRGEDDPAPWPISNYRVPAFPVVWLRAPTQASGELDKVVGFPIVPRGLRDELKAMPFDVDLAQLDPATRDELADLVWKATLQPASTFMNSVRERLSAAARAGTGGARVGGSYIQGAIFNPKTLISLLNIFRVHYNFFEARPYASPFDGDDNPALAVRLTPRSLRMPGTNERIELKPRARRTPDRKTPAMRHGMDAFVRRKTGKTDVPSLHRLIYRPWLYAGTRVGAKLDRSWAGRKPEPEDVVEDDTIEASG